MLYRVGGYCHRWAAARRQGITLARQEKEEESKNLLLFLYMPWVLHSSSSSTTRCYTKEGCKEGTHTPDAERREEEVARRS